MNSTAVRITQAEFNALVRAQSRAELSGPDEHGDEHALASLITAAEQNGLKYTGFDGYDRAGEAA